MLDANEIREKLKTRIAMYGQSRFADMHGLTQPYISQVMGQDAPISARLADALGYERVIMYRKK